MSETKPGMPSLTEEQIRGWIKEELANYEQKLIQWNAKRQMKGILDSSNDYIDFVEVTLQGKQRDPSESQATEAESDRVYQTHYHSMD